METITLSADTRTIRGRKIFGLRKEGKVPAVVYGGGLAESTSLSMDAAEFARVHRSAGESTLIDLVIDNATPLKVLIHAIQRDPLLGTPLHIDFRNIDMSKPIETNIELIFVGESPAVKALGGILLKTREEVEVRCLPQNLVPSIEVDLSVLETFDDVIHVSDIQVPEGLEMLTNAERTVAAVNAPRTEAEMASLDEEVVEDVEAVEGEEKEEGKDVEGEEKTEGDAKKDEGEKKAE